MTDWPRGGYSAGDTPASELKPPPDSMISKSSLPATYTAAEVKVLTEAALRLGRREVGEQIAIALEARDGAEWALAGQWAGIDAARIALDVSSRAPQDPSSARTDLSVDTDLPQDPQTAREAL